MARPARVYFVPQLPKTRSGKLLRRSIQAICEGRTQCSAAALAVASKAAAGAGASSAEVGSGTDEAAPAAEEFVQLQVRLVGGG